MAIESVGYYALPIIPSLKGADKSINSQFKGLFGNVGKTGGRQMATGIASGLKTGAADIERATKAAAKSVDKLANASGQAGVEIKKLNDVVSKSGSTQGQIAQQSERVARSLRAEAAAAREDSAAQAKLASAKKSAASSSGVSIGNPLRDTERNLTRSSGGLSSAAAGLGTKVGGAFMGAFTAVAGGAAILGVVKSAIDTGLDFERQVNTFSGVANVGADGMNKMREAARALGTDTKLAGTSASDAAAAMVELAKGGLTADQAMTAARGTLQLATAGQLDAAEAAKIQSAALNIFQLKAGDATHVADLLAASANASSADVTDLGMALQQGGSVAAGFGVSIEDTLTALTLFSKWGINGSDAGTMLKTSLQAITDQGKPAQGAIDELGLSLYDANGQFVGVESMMKQVGEASKRMTQEQFQAATAVLFGSDAMRASMVSANGGADAWNATADAVNRQGAAADMAAANMQGLPGVVESLSNAWEGLKLKLFDVLDGPLIAIGNTISGLLSGEGGTGFLGEYAAKIGGFFSDLGNTLRPVFDYLGQAFKGIGNWFRDAFGPEYLGYVDKVKTALGPFFQQLVATFKEAMPVLKAVGTVIGVVLVGAFKALGVVYPMFIKGMTAVLTVAQGVYKGIKLGWDLLVGAFNVGKTIVLGVWDGLKGAISIAWSVISPIVDGFKAAFGFLADAARYAFDTVILPMWHNFQLVAGVVWAALQPVFEGLKTAWSAIADAATSFWQGAIVPVWEGIKVAFTAGWGAIQPVFQWIKDAFQGVRDFVSGVWNGLAGIVKSALDGVVGAVRGPINALGRLLQKVPTSIGPVQIPGAQIARDLGNSLAGFESGTTFVTGPAGRDKVIARLTRGEGVVTEPAMRAGGTPIVAALNRGWVPSPKLLHSMLPGYETGTTSAGMPEELTDWLNSVEGTPYKWGTTDCSGAVSQLVNVAMGKPPSSGRMSTANAEQWLEERGFQRGTGGRGTLRVGWINNPGGPGGGHMAATLPDGRNFESGGSNAGITIGSKAAGADDSQFTNQMFLPIEGFYPDGEASGSDSGAPTGRVPAGSTAGTNSKGEQGYYTPDPQAVQEAQAKVTERETRKREVDANAKAKESEKIRAQRLLDEANADLADAKKGKFTKFTKSELGGEKSKSGDDDLSEVGKIGKSFLDDMFGLGDLLPDPSELGIVKLAQALMGISYTPQGKGFPWETGYANGDGTPGSGTPVNPLAGLVEGGDGANLPLGLIPGVSSVLPDNVGEPVAHGQAGGAPPGPANVDQSTNLTINNPQGDERSIADRTRRVILKTPRLGTYEK